MKGNQALLKIILSMIIVIAVGVIIFTVRIGDIKEETTTASISSETQTISKTVRTSKLESETSSAETSTSKAKTEADTAFIHDGWWYYFDKKNFVAYAFSFDKNGNVDLASFSSANINEEDAEFFEGYSQYTIENDKIVMKNLPGGMGINAITLTLGKNSISYKGFELVKYDKLSLGNAVNYF